MRQGYSNTMRHLERTHGVSLRSLAEHFNAPYCQLDYERSALQSGDIFTKGFTSPPDWQRATKLINHLDPVLFWSGPDGKRKPAMPEIHKGGVKYAYWSSNPWAENQLDDTSQADRYYQAKASDDKINPDQNPRLNKRKTPAKDATSASHKAVAGLRVDPEWDPLTSRDNIIDEAIDNFAYDIFDNDVLDSLHIQASST